MTNLTEISLEQKIKNEKRRRTQIYNTLDYFLSNFSYFDFFSYDAFSIAKKSKNLAFLLKSKKVTLELLFLSFFSPTNELSEVISYYIVNQKMLSDISTLVNKKLNNNFSETFLKIKHFFFKSTFNQEQNENEIIFSLEVQAIFEKAAENALFRFKSPIISSEILFITIMEEKNYKSFKLIKKLFENETNWHLLRYQLIKRIHNYESNIRSEISINQQYFAYLLKTQLKDNQFNRLIEEDNLRGGVSLFRNTLISEVLKQNFFEIFADDIFKNIQILKTRHYSS